MAVKAFDVPSIGTVYIQKRRGTSRLKLRINQKHQIVVTQPTWMPYKAGLEFAKSQSVWISKHQKSPKIFTHLQPIGKHHALFFIPTPNLNAVRVTVTERDVRVRYPEDMTPDDEMLQKAAKRGARKALNKETKLLEDRLNNHAKKHNVSYTSLSFKFMTSKWGSRRSDGTITLNYRLLDLPDELIDYVIIHELAHTKYMNHSAEYWRHVASMMPDYLTHRKNLKKVDLPWHN